MTIPLFKKLYKIFPCISFGYSLVLTAPLYGLSTAQELKSCKSALLSQINEQKRLEVQGCPISEKLVYWLGILRDPHQFTPSELSSFLDSHGHWPHHEKLCKKAEEVISDKASPDEVLVWFENHPPQTPEGVIVYGNTLLSNNQEQKAIQVVGNGWATMSLTKAQEKEFLTYFSQLLQKKHHIARLEFLLWDENVEEAKRLLARVPVYNQKIAKVRIGFLENTGDALQKMEALPSELHKNEGLLYEKAKWHRKRKDFEDASQILLKAPIGALNAKKWWREQSYIAREFLALREYNTAYQIVKRHNLKTDLQELGEAEWFAGWLALRFLDKSNTALKHFKTLAANVKGAVSKSKSAYWIGRTYEAKGETSLAGEAYSKAARYKTTYYGQLAAAKIKEKPFPVLSAAPRATKAEKERFHRNELVKAAHILKGLGGGADHELIKFLFEIAGQAETKAERELSVQLAHMLSPYDVVWTAKKAGYSEPVLLKTAFPTLPIPRKGQKIPEHPLVMAIAYQETRFVPWARSEANAMGLLQILPTTGAEQAKALGIPHREEKLLDPHHNLVLGSAYLSHLLDNFMGSYVVLFAAYNAGPGRVEKWLKEFGDPRSGNVDIIDWIEMIPYAETRNYVMRVLENVSNYRSALQEDPKKTIIDDLTR